jgi:hypothetical protein
MRLLWGTKLSGLRVKSCEEISLEPCDFHSVLYLLASEPVMRGLWLELSRLKSMPIPMLGGEDENAVGGEELGHSADGLS